MLLGGLKRVLSGHNFHKAEEAQPSGTSSGTNTPVQTPKRQHTCEEGTAASTSSSHASGLQVQTPAPAATSRVGDAGVGVRSSGLPPVPTASSTPTANYSSLAASGAAAYAVMFQGFSRGVVPSFSPGGLLGTAGSGVSLPPPHKQQQQDGKEAAADAPKLALGLTRSQSVPALESLGGSGTVATSTANSSHPQVVLSHQNFWLA